MKKIEDLIETSSSNGNEIKILPMNTLGIHFPQPDIERFEYNPDNDEDQSKWYTKQTFNYNNKTKEKHRFRKFAIMFYYMKKYDCKSVLDVGFGSGYHTWNAAVNGFDTVGADFENGAYFTLQDLISNSDLDTLELLSLNKHKISDLGRTFDAVFSIEVLEHILDPIPLHEEQIKMCGKVFFLEEYCGDRSVTGHIAPHKAKQEIKDMCFDYGFIQLPTTTFGYPPEIFVKKELL